MVEVGFDVTVVELGSVDVGPVVVDAAVVAGVVVDAAVVEGAVVDVDVAAVVVGNSDSGNEVVGQGFADSSLTVVVVLAPSPNGADRLHSVVVVVAAAVSVDFGAVVVRPGELVGASASGFCSSG